MGRIAWIINRAYCNIFGCDIDSYSSAYMPDDWNPPHFCKRCDACHDVYQFETTEHELIYPQESIYGRLKYAMDLS